MDENAYRQRLIEFLASPQNQNDGNNYGYMSSMPLNDTPRADAALGAISMLAGGAALGVSPWQGPMAPVAALAGAGLFADGAGRVGRNGLQLRGIHPDQAKMDAYVQRMNQTGMGPR